MTNRQVAKSDATDNASLQTVVRPERMPPKTMASSKKPGGLFPRLAQRKTPKVKPDATIVKSESNDTTPASEIVTVGGTNAVHEAIPTVPTPLANAKNSKATAIPVTIRSDASPIKTQTTEPGAGKIETITLKSTHITYGASPDYTVLVGRVQEWRKTLRLRYAAVEQTDVHGGSVLLEAGVEQLPLVRDGQHIRVRGVLTPAEDRVSGARFRVDAMEILD